MKKVQLTLSDENRGLVRADDLIANAMAARRQGHQKAEELRMKVLDLAERHMDITLQVLKKWLQK